MRIYMCIIYMCVYIYILFFFPPLSLWEVGMLPAGKAALPPPPGSALRGEPGGRRQLRAGAAGLPRRGAGRAQTPARERGAGRKAGAGGACALGTGGLGVRGTLGRGEG